MLGMAFIWTNVLLVSAIHGPWATHIGSQTSGAHGSQDLDTEIDLDTCLDTWVK